LEESSGVLVGLVLCGRGVHVHREEIGVRTLGSGSCSTGCFGFSKSLGVLLGNDIAQFQEVAALDFGIVRFGIRWEIEKYVFRFGIELPLFDLV
jgi:hypothetical protein